MPSSSLSRFTRAYYRAKPFIPRALRWAMRRRRARKLLREHADTWPIDEAAGAAPENWPGWPDGKQFAFVLTHDVETQQGLDRVRALAELEMELGFRSSFNFVPEGEYEVPKDLLEWFAKNGFELGIHDLHHDGRLFDSREVFREKAQRINRYIDQWDASGFRAGFMLRQLDWFHDLEIQYDASTFDTDPFEPQPDGARTIFPFWVNNDGEPSYVELPYTLPQDSTSYILLQESTSDIWKRKLDWIAQRGGMALLIVHPDYTSMGDRPGRYEYPVSRFLQFLEWVKATYSEDCWFALPRDVATYYRNAMSGHVEKPISANCFADNVESKSPR